MKAKKDSAELAHNSKAIAAALDDVKKGARAAGLVYVSDSQPGYTRVKRGGRFIYLDHQGRKLQEDEPLKRIQRLVIPPAWTKVWICKLDNGHLQATGFDKNSRKQYRYHPQWVVLRSQTKFYRLGEFAETLPRIRARYAQDLSLRGFPRGKCWRPWSAFLNLRISG